MSLYQNKNIKPMLLSEIENPFDDKDYIFELKFDGVRALIYASPKEVTIISRNGKNLNDLFPELLEIKNIVKKEVIFDGEITILKNKMPSFETLQKRMHLKDKSKINKLKNELPAIFMCFDIIYDGKDISNFKLLKRKSILEKYEDTNEFIKVKYFIEEGKKLFNAVKKLNLEGIVAKNIHSTYQINYRSKDWIKIKNLKDDDFYICGYSERESVASLLLGIKKENRLFYVGKVTLGKKKKDFEKIKSCKTTKNNFTNFNDKSYTYISPILKCTVIFLEKTKNGSLRHPIFKCLKS